MHRLETLRLERKLSVPAFAQWLGLSAGAYQRLLTDPSAMTAGIQQQIGTRLDLPPARWGELLMPPLTPERLAAVLAALHEADEQGWIEVDPETLEPTGVRICFPAGAAGAMVVHQATPAAL